MPIADEVIEELDENDEEENRRTHTEQFAKAMKPVPAKLASTDSKNYHNQSGPSTVVG